MSSSWYKKSQFVMNIPETLYHATYGANLPKIKDSGGILPEGDFIKCWPSCVSGVYLHSNPDVAYSYPETADVSEIPDEYYESIVVLEIDATKLNIELFEYDPNILPNLDDDLENSYVYHGKIPLSAIKRII